MRVHNSGHCAWGMSKVAAEIEQGALAHGLSDALGVDQAMGEVGLSVLGPPGLGAPNEHDAHDSGRTCFRAIHIYTIMALHSAPPHDDPLKSTSCRDVVPEIPPRSTKLSANSLNLG